MKSINTHLNTIVAGIIVASLLSIGSVSFAADIKLSKAERVGMSSERLNKIDEMSKRYIKQGNYSGVVTLVARKGKVVHLSAHGDYGVDNATPMAPDTLFRIYSMTKPVTAIAALMLYEQGKFQMDDPVSKYLPEFEHQKLLIRDEKNTTMLVNPKSEMTMRQLFTHTAGLTYGTTLDNHVDQQYKDAKILESGSLSEFTKKLSELPLRFQPGTRYHYSVSLDLLGAVIERLSGMPLDQFFQTRIFQPLAMEDTFFEVPADKLSRLASDQYWDRDKNKIASVPSAKSRNFGKVSFFSGGGGLVSTAENYMRFCQMILNGGSYKGARLLGPRTIKFFGSDHLSDLVRAEGVGQYPSADLYSGQSMALGLGVVINPDAMPVMSSKGDLSWGGAAGTKFWIDREQELIGIAMVQLFQSPWPLRFDMQVAVNQAITELN
ncbi:MAG: CubicO group peptidase (beta-lactamase class C family) [Arenicella sp.]|jgi:CubicO group peptidase (beta-lactamase class C family)